MRTLALPDRNAPTNMRLKESVQVRYLDGDLLDIARQVKARHPSLYVVELTDPENEPGKAAWAIIESCADGVERMLCKVRALDQRLLAKLDHIMHVPFAQRFADAEAGIERDEAQAKEAELDQLYETIGRPMLTQMRHDGFADTSPVSYPKRGISYTSYKTLAA